jgi:hypothetical protein
VTAFLSRYFLEIFLLEPKMFARVVVVVYCVKIVPSCLAKDTLLHHFHEKHPERDVIHVIFSLSHS